MTNVEKFFKEWGSVCRIFTKKDKAIYSHKELLDFAEQYRQSKVNNVVLHTVNQQRELLKGFVEYVENEFDIYAYTPDIKEHINNYIKTL